MEMEFLKMFAGQGAFAVLFIWLFMDTRKENKLREKEMRETIDKNQEIIERNQDIIQENQKIIGKLSENFSVVETIKEDIEDIKEIVLKNRSDI